MAKEFKRYLVTSALPYANGPVHIGHLAGVYIPSDIYTRYLRLKGCDVISVCGSDEHGVPITIKARKEGVTPQQIVDRYHNLIKKSFEGLGMSFDIYSRTSSATHAATASEFFRKLYDEGKFIEKTSMQYYDEEAQTFLADRYIVGTCPKCGNDRAYGDQCEKCGSTLSPDELIDPHSAVSCSVPVKRETKHWYLPLDQYEGFLREWILDGHKEWKTNVYGQCKSWLDGGLQPRAVSRDLDWGIPVPVEGAEGKVLYVWFDAPIGYISATKDLTPDWEKYWKSEDTKMVHFIGKDNIVFHCIVFPSMLKAHGGYILPENVPANEFLNLEGDKISTSRNWAVWLHEYLEEFPGKEDVLRYVLCANAPETKDNDFIWKDFQARNNNELVAVLGNFVNRALVLTQKYYGGEVPACGEMNDYDRQTVAEVAAVKGSLEANIENYRFREALKDAMNIARIGNKYLADTEPWKVIKTDSGRVKTILNIALQITANTAIAIEPFMPFSASKILKKLAQYAGSPLSCVLSWIDGKIGAVIAVRPLIAASETPDGTKTPRTKQKVNIDFSKTGTGTGSGSKTVLDLNKIIPDMKGSAAYTAIASRLSAVRVPSLATAAASLAMPLTVAATTLPQSGGTAQPTPTELAYNSQRRGGVTMSKFCDTIEIHIANADGKGYNQIEEEVTAVLKKVLDEYEA